MKRFIVLFVALFALAHSAQVQYSCIDLKGEVKQCPQNSRPTSFGDQLVAFAKYAKRINETGWNELEIVSNGHLPDDVQAYYAGYLEGFLTAGLIKSLRHNMLQEDKKQWCTKLGHFITENLRHTIAEVHQKKHDPYWHEVGLTLYQVAGLDDGSARAESGKGHKKPHLDLNPCGNILMNLYTEFSDMLSIMRSQVEERETRCSAIIKYLPQKGDVYVAHNTWSNFYTMIRIMKKYTLNFSTSQAKSVAMSSYPGNVFSTDDYYITSQHMVVQETSIENFNSSMWNGLNSTNFVFEFIRNTVANRLATSGAEWATVFSRLNGGTYNNQFMIVDYKRLENKIVQPGLLTVLEQMPNLIVSADMTGHLKEHTYWASYNVPFFKQVYSESGNERMAQEDDFYSYNKTARALIFARDHHKVVNISSLYHLMRYNDMFHDPLSRCNCTPPYTGEYAIAARCDLNDPNGSYPISDLSFRPHGAIDAKLTSAELARELQMVAVSGPTDEGVPAFSWATTRLHGIPHLDEPIEWKFKPLRTTWGNTHDVFPNFNFDF